MPQDIINLAISGVAALLGWLMRIIWETQQHQQEETKKLSEKVNSIEVLVVGRYITRDEMAAVLNRIDNKLELITQKLDSKVDKP